LTIKLIPSSYLRQRLEMKNESRRWKAGSRLIGLALALLWLTGCVSPDILQKDYGNSLQNNIAQSVLNPQAGLQDIPTTGLPPKAGANEMDTYNKSFTGQAPSTAATGGMGSSSIGGATGAPSTPGQ
jgi:hypothetical protein